MTLSPEQLAATWEEYRRTRTDALRNKLVEQYVPWVHHIARVTKGKLITRADSHDLAQYGMFGLIHAVTRFDPSSTIKFTTYAQPRVYGAIMDGLRAVSDIPRLTHSRAKTIEALEERHLAATGLAIREEQIRDELGPQFSGNRVRKTVHFSTMLRGYKDGRKDEIEVPAVPKNIDTKLDAEAIVRIVLEPDGVFSVTEALLIRMYYFDLLTMKQISECLDISESRVSQLHAAILLRIRSRLRLPKKPGAEEPVVPRTRKPPTPRGRYRRSRPGRSLKFRTSVNAIIPQMLAAGCRVTDAILMKMYYVQMCGLSEICEALKYASPHSVKKRRQKISDRLRRAGAI